MILTLIPHTGQICVFLSAVFLSFSPVLFPLSQDESFTGFKRERHLSDIDLEK